MKTDIHPAYHETDDRLCLRRDLSHALDLSATSGSVSALPAIPSLPASKSSSIPQDALRNSRAVTLA
jgi:hypothetical protein